MGVPPSLGLRGATLPFLKSLDGHLLSPIRAFC